MTKWIVWSLDMWGHVAADCCKSYLCKCVNEDDEHDVEACDCCEDMNDRFRVGSFETEEDSDKKLIELLISNDFLVNGARVEIEDYSDGSWLGVLDLDGRQLLALEREET